MMATLLASQVNCNVDEAGSKKNRSAASRKTAERRQALQLELKAYGNLARAITTKIRTSRRGNLPEIGIRNIELRIVQIRVIQHIGKRAFRAQVDALRYRNLFAETSRPVYGARSDDVSNTLIAEAPDGVGRHADAA